MLINYVIASVSLTLAHIPEWVQHQWQAINQGYISSTCKKVFESIRIIIYDDVNMRNYFLKDTRLANYCLDILLSDNQEVIFNYLVLFTHYLVLTFTSFWVQKHPRCCY